MIIAIDGPAGSGKSTTAAAVAARLGFRHLDSGALYRALTFALLREGIPEEEWPGLDSEVLGRISVELEPVAGGFRILLDGRPLGDELRSREVTSRVSLAARVPAVRERLLRLQRAAPLTGGIVADGRDMGSVVFPEAELKVFLTAGVEDRARRRLLQEGREADPEAIREEVRRIEERDRRDREREVAPLVQVPGALVLDTSAMDFEEQVRRIVAAAHGLTGGAPPE